MAKLKFNNQTIIVEKMHDYKTQQYIFISAIYEGKRCVKQILKTFKTKKQAFKFTKDLIENQKSTKTIMQKFA